MLTAVREKDRLRALERLSKQERIVFWDESGKLVIPFDPEYHSVLLRSKKIVIRSPGTLEIYRLRYVHTHKENGKFFTDYVAGECLSCYDVENDQVPF